MKKTNYPLIAEFPALLEPIDGRRMIYLDSACTALKMKSAAKAQQEFLLKSGGCGGQRSVHLLSQKVEEAYQMARNLAAEFTGAATADEIIFTTGTTDAINQFAGAFPFTAKKNEVVLSALEHNSAFLPFYNLSRTGKIKLRIIPLKGSQPDLKALSAMLNRKTALVCLSRASNFFGGITDYQTISAMAKSSGAAVFYDDAQYAPTHEVCAAVSGADALAFSGHKLGAPFGTGVLWVKEELRNKLSPFKVGGGTVKNIQISGNNFSVEYLQGYQGFEAGVQNYAGAVALAETFNRLKSAGRAEAREYISGLVGYAVSRLAEVKGVRLLNTAENLKHGSIVSFVSENKSFSQVDFNLYLNNASGKHFIAARTGRHCADLAVLGSGIPEVVRLSFFVYTTKKDIDAFISMLSSYNSTL